MELVMMPGWLNNKMSESKMSFEIKINIEKVKEIHRSFIRTAREPKFVEADLKFMKSVETDDIIKKQEAVNLKQKLRDATINPNLESATTLQEIKDSWDTELLGESPYNLYSE